MCGNPCATRAKLIRGEPRQPRTPDVSHTIGMANIAGEGYDGLPKQKDLRRGNWRSQGCRAGTVLLYGPARRTKAMTVYPSRKTCEGEIGGAKDAERGQYSCTALREGRRLRRSTQAERPAKGKLAEPGMPSGDSTPVRPCEKDEGYDGLPEQKEK